MFRIVVSLREKRSTQSQYENATVGVDLEASGLELSTPEEIVGRTRQLFQIARSAVQGELLQAIPERTPSNGHADGPNGNDHANGNGHHAAGRNGNGNGRSFGRPNPEPSPKQRVLLQRLAKERGLSAEQVGEAARRELGKSVPQLNRHEMSRLLEMLMEQEARS